MQPENTVGAVVKEGGTVLSISQHCALTGQRIDSGTVTSPVPGWPGLYMRTAASAHRQMTPMQASLAIAKVIAWYEAQRQADKEPEMPEDDPGDTEDESED